MKDGAGFIRCQTPHDILVVPDHQNPEEYSHVKDPCHNHRIMRECQYLEGMEALKSTIRELVDLANEYLIHLKRMQSEEVVSAAKVREVESSIAKATKEGRG